MTEPTKRPYRPGPVFTNLPADAFPTEANAGESTCPICGLTWLVTPWNDCFLPACGCYGQDASTGNRPCEGCGMGHVRTCKNDHAMREAIPAHLHDATCTHDPCHCRFGDLSTSHNDPSEMQS